MCVLVLQEIKTSEYREGCSFIWVDLDYNKVPLQVHSKTRPMILSGSV
jgi:hypothetical protein